MGRFKESQIEDFSTDYDREMVPATRSGKVVNSKYVNVRDKPSKDGVPIGQLQRGSLVTILGRTGDYYQIQYMNYPKAYVAEHFIEED